MAPHPRLCAMPLTVDDLGNGVTLVQITSTAFALCDRAQALVLKLKEKQLVRLSKLNMATKRMKLSEYKNVTVNVFQGKPYYHFRDVRKDKSLTLTYAELKTILSNGSRLLKYARKLLKESKKSDKASKKKNKSSKRRKNAKSKYDDDSEMSSCDETARGGGSEDEDEDDGEEEEEDME